MTIYYLNPSTGRSIWGGVQKLHDHVSILSDAGIDAAVASADTFDGHWFPMTAPTVTLPVEVDSGDLLAVPEMLGDHLRTLAPGVPRVSINQNTFRMYKQVARPHRHPYLENPDLISVLTISEHDRALVAASFPDLPVQRAFLGIDPATFAFRPGDRPRRLAYMPRKNGAAAALVLQALSASHLLDGWEVVPIDGLPQRAVGETLSRCRLFLSFAQEEGFGLPGAEALAAGCSVVGFSGVGGNEYFSGATVHRVPDGDTLAFIDTASAWLRADPWNEPEARAASDAILSTYHPGRERDSVLSFFRAALADPRIGSGIATGIIAEDMLVPRRPRLDRAVEQIRGVAQRLRGVQDGA